MHHNIRSILSQIITEPDLDQKILLANSLSDFTAEPITKIDEKDLVAFKKPGRPEHICITHPRKVPKRNINDAKNRAHLLHALANIELLAIELPALCLLRFGSNDLSFIQNQMQIITEEARHFGLLKNRLNQLDVPFGSVPIHMGLWDHAWRCDSELEHQIAIPCYLEARGLDVCPEFVCDLKRVGDDASAEILQIILDDEIKHVKSGMTYLKHKSTELHESEDTLFESILSRVFSANLKSKIKVNRNYRTLAGFTEHQLRLIETGSLTQDAS